MSVLTLHFYERLFMVAGAAARLVFVASAVVLAFAILGTGLRPQPEPAETWFAIAVVLLVLALALVGTAAWAETRAMRMLRSRSERNA